MKCSTTRIFYWEIWRSKRIAAIFATATAICLLLRTMDNTAVQTNMVAVRDNSPETKDAFEGVGSLKSTILHRYKNTRKKSSQHLNKSLVLLVANQRSGSTFLGEIFNQNPKAFYLFEPLFPFSKHCDHLKQERVNLLQELLQCNYGSIKEAYKDAFAVTEFSDKDAECLKNNLCFETSHKPLLQQYAMTCSGAARNITQILERDIPKKTRFNPESIECGFPLNTSLVSQLCYGSDIVAFKVLRLCSLRDIEVLRSRVLKHGMDVFVIHLVRDPRAVVSSRINLRVDGVRLHNAPAETDLLCNRYKRNINYIEELESDTTSNMISDGHYLRIRHEDFTMNPFKLTNRIYKFIGKKVPKEVEHFLAKCHQNMKGILERIEREDKKAIKENKEVKKYTRSKDLLWHMNNPFGTVRDPKEVLSTWRTLLPFAVVSLVQEKCGDVFLKLGYKLFRSNVDLVNLTKSYYK